MTAVAIGEFDVKLTPQSNDVPAEGASLGRFTLEKRFRGDLDGVSAGEMLTAGSQLKGSAGYVAVERFSGALHGCHGTFALQHFGVMNRGAGTLDIRVVPDSGTGGLAGISGTLAIEITGGKHLYRFEYSIDAANGPGSPS